MPGMNLQSPQDTRSTRPGSCAEFGRAPCGALSLRSLDDSGTGKEASPEALFCELCASELRYRRIFENARDGILVIDPNTGRVLDVNPFVLDLLSLSREQVVSRQLFELGLFKDERSWTDAFAELMAKGAIFCGNIQVQTQDKRVVEVELLGNLYHEGSHRIVLVNVHDITSFRRIQRIENETRARLAAHAVELEQEVVARTSDLQQINQQLRTFVYSIAHDLRAPLRAMQGFSQLLVQDHANVMDDTARGYANLINQAAQNMDNLLSDLLSFSQISQQTIEMAPVNLGTVIQNSIEACTEEITKSGAVIECSASWPVAQAYPPVLKQVLINLLVNAIKFVDGRAPHVILRPEKVSKDRIRVWIEDNGIGIPPEGQERIFQVFQRLHSTRYAGTGIGLAIVQRGIERMGGRVGVISTPGKGSRFWFELATPSSSTGPK